MPIALWIVAMQPMNAMQTVPVIVWMLNVLWSQMQGTLVILIKRINDLWIIRYLNQYLYMVMCCSFADHVVSFLSWNTHLEKKCYRMDKVVIQSSLSADLLVIHWMIFKLSMGFKETIWTKIFINSLHCTEIIFWLIFTRKYVKKIMNWKCSLMPIC